MWDTFPSLVIVGNPGCRRVAGFQAALAGLGGRPARLVSYADLLTRKTRLADHLEPGTVVRVESAAEDWETYKLLLLRGVDPAAAEGYPVLGPADVRRVPFERGWIGRPRQLYLGFCRLLEELQCDLDETHARALQPPRSIALFFDKRQCQEKLAAAGLPIPEPYPTVESYDTLRASFGGDGRVMVKLAHGSGAAGCVAIHWSRGRTRALTTVAAVAGPNGPRLYCSKRLVYLRDERAVARLVDRLVVEGVHAEAWLAKARIGGRGFDLRVLTINERPTHAVARISSSPFTNLNLGNRRGDADVLRNEVSREAWNGLRLTCTRLANLFPSSLYLGIDVLLRPDRTRHVVLEVNAFGDLLHDVRGNGLTPYEAEVVELRRSWQPAAVAS